MFIQKTLQAPENPDLPLFVEWLEFLKWLLATTEKFPKKLRFTFSDRINGLALGIVEDLVEARYSKYKLPSLKKININLEKIRVLLRISYESQILSQKAYEYSTHSLYEIGKQLGGWVKQQEMKAPR